MGMFKLEIVPKYRKPAMAMLSTLMVWTFFTSAPAAGIFYMNSCRKEASSFIENTEKTIASVKTSASAEDQQKEARLKQAELNGQEKEAMASVWKVWNFNKNKMKKKATWGKIEKAKGLVEKLPETDVKSRLDEAVTNASATLKEREETATAAVKGVWNEELGNVTDNISRENLKEAEDKVKKLPEGDFKDNLNEQLKRANDVLTEMEVHNKAINATEKVIEILTGTLQEDAAMENIDEALAAVAELPDSNEKTDLTDKLNDAREALQEKIAREAAEERERINNTCPSGGGAGNAGTLYIPSVGLTVPIYEGTWNLSADQAIVDRQNSAVYGPAGYYACCDFIADHTDQGFSKIKEAEPGWTKAYVVRTDGSVQTYICTDKFKGHNTGDDLTDWSGNSIKQNNAGGLGMYTCNENWRNITIVFWQPV